MIFKLVTDTHTYTLSLHDALPICATHSRTCATEPGAEVSCSEYSVWIESTTAISGFAFSSVARMRSSCSPRSSSSAFRSEEHTSELQSRFDLVCRLLL